MSGEVMTTKWPWISGNLTFDAQILREAEAHALETYPSECCGFMGGPLTQPELINFSKRENNLADKYHALDPEHFPRTSTTYFKIDELRALRAFETAENEQQPIKVIYHSHCDAGAYFSEEDAATFANDHQLLWPCAFLVISVQSGQVVDRKLWVHRPNSNAFVESSFQVKA